MGRQYGTPAKVRGQWRHRDPHSEAIGRLQEARHVVRLLRQARDSARLGGMVQTLGRIQRAIASAGGAVRHAEGRVGRVARRIYG